MKVLLTGFDPFGGEAVNPAQEAVQRVSDNINGAEVIKITIPTVQTKSVKAIEEAIELYNPDIVISVGQAAGRYDINSYLLILQEIFFLLYLLNIYHS